METYSFASPCFESLWLLVTSYPLLPVYSVSWHTTIQERLLTRLLLFLSGNTSLWHCWSHCKTSTNNNSLSIAQKAWTPLCVCLTPHGIDSNTLVYITIINIPTVDGVISCHPYSYYFHFHVVQANLRRRHSSHMCRPLQPYRYTAALSSSLLELLCASAAGSGGTCRVCVMWMSTTRASSFSKARLLQTAARLLKAAFVRT